MLINKEGGVLLRLVLIKFGVVLFWGYVVCFVVCCKLGVLLLLLWGGA